MINRVVLIGRLTRDLELKHTSNDVAVASFTLAVNRQFTNSQGEREADFVNCVVWRKTAENFANFTHKGSLVGIDGRIQTRNYENQQGSRVYVTEVVVDNFSLLESKNSNSSDNTNNNSNKAPSYNQSNSSNNNNNMSDPFADNSKPVDISDDDLPF